MTQAFYGSYAFAANELFVSSWTQEAQFTRRGWMRSNLITATLGGFKTGNAAAVTTAVNAMVAALSVNGQDFGLYDDSGNLTYFALPSAGSYGGVKVISKPSFQQVDGAQLATRLDYMFTLQAEYPVTESAVGAGIVQYQETLTFSGGIPVLIVRPCVNSQPVEQVVSPCSPFVVNQSGILITLSANPQANPPLWPDKLVDRQVSPVTADLNRGGFVQQAVSWSYTFQSATALTGSSLAY